MCFVDFVCIKLTIICVQNVRIIPSCVEICHQRSDILRSCQPTVHLLSYVAKASSCHCEITGFVAVKWKPEAQLVVLKNKKCPTTM